MHEIEIKICGTDEEIIAQLEQIKQRVARGDEHAEVGVYGGNLDAETGYQFFFNS